MGQSDENTVEKEMDSKDLKEKVGVIFSFVNKSRKTKIKHVLAWLKRATHPQFLLFSAHYVSMLFPSCTGHKDGFTWQCVCLCEWVNQKQCKVFWIQIK